MGERQGLQKTKFLKISKKMGKLWVDCGCFFCGFKISALKSYLGLTGYVGLEATIKEKEVQVFLHVGFWGFIFWRIRSGV